MKTRVPCLILALLAAPTLAQERLPILDVHLHALPVDHLGPPPRAMCTPMPSPAWDPSQPYRELFDGLAKDPPCADPVWSPTTNEAMMNETIAVMERLNIYGVLSGTEPDRISAWRRAAPGHRARLHSPLTMEEVLVRHPRLRVYLMHAGYPMLDDLLAVLYAHPQVYVDVGIIVFQQPRAEFYRYLRTIVEAGFGDRVMFGSDQVIWPGVIERAVAVIEEAPFLDEEQKRDVLYNNAARFLRLSEEEIARHRSATARPSPPE